MKKTLAVLSLVLIVATACGDPDVNLGAGGSSSGSSGNPGSGDEPVSSGPLDPSLDPNPDPQASPVDPNPDAVNTMPIRWDSYEERAGGNELEMLFWSGVEPCYVLAEVEVEETPDKVTVTLHQGNLETEEDTACIEIALLKSTIVELDEPLGDRKVVDGSRKG